MKPTGVVALAVLLPALVSAQDAMVEVPAGRQFQQYKVLTLGLVDRWRFDLDVDEFVQCVVETGDFDPVLELFDHDGQRLATDDGAGTRSELRWFAPAKGAYEFAVQGYEGRGGGNYRFWLLRYRTERIAPDSSAEHTFGPERWWHFRVPMQRGDVLVPRVATGGTLTAVLDLDQRALPEWHGGYTALADGDVLLRVEGNERDHCRVDVQRALQTQLGADGDLSGELGDGGMRIVRHGFAPGAYTLELDTPEHDLVVDLRETEPAAQPRFGWTGSLDKNGRQRRWLLVRAPMAAELVLRNHGEPASHRGRLVPAGDPAAFGVAIADRLALGGGRLFRLEVHPGQLVRVAAVSGSFDARLDLWTPDGAVHGFDDRARLDLGAEHVFLVRQHGAHYALVYTTGGAGSGPFTLRVDDVPIPELAVGAKLAVQAGLADAFAHLACTEGQALWLSVQSPRFDPALLVFDPDGEQVGAFEGGGVGWDVLNGFVARKAGVHTLQVVSRHGRGDGVLRAIAP